MRPEDAAGNRTGGESLSERLNKGISAIQDDDFTFVLILLLLITLNLGDFAFTSQVLSRGYREANPIMGYLFRHSPALAGLTKLVLILAVAVISWTLRRHRKVVVAALFAVEVYLILFVYHLVINALAG